MPAPSLRDLSRALRDGSLTSRQLVEAALARIDDPHGEGARTFTLVLRDDALRDADAIDRALDAVRSRGARVDEHPLPSLDDLDSIHRNGGHGGAESWAWYRELLLRGAHLSDPRVRVRIEAGRHMTAEALATLHHERALWQRAMHAELAGYDAFVSPTCSSAQRARAAWSGSPG